MKKKTYFVLNHVNNILIIYIDRYVSIEVLREMMMGLCMLVSNFMLFNIHTLRHAHTPACSQAWSILIDLFTAHPSHRRNECLTWGHKTLRGWRESFIYPFTAVLTLMLFIWIITVPFVKKSLLLVQEMAITAENEAEYASHNTKWTLWYIHYMYKKHICIFS